MSYESVASSDLTQPSRSVLRGRGRRVIEALRDRILPSRRVEARRLAQVALSAENDAGAGAQQKAASATGDGKTHTAGKDVVEAAFELPGDVVRRIATGDIPDPMWYVGRTGPSVQDVLDADDTEFERLKKLVHHPSGNGSLSRRRRRSST